MQKAVKVYLLHNHPHKGKEKSQQCAQNGNFCCKICKSGERKYKTPLCVCVAIPETKLN